MPPKRPTVETATFLAVSHFNDGSKCLLSVLKQLGIVPGVYCEKSSVKLDDVQICHSQRKSREPAKKGHQQLCKLKKGYIATLS